MRKSVVIFLFVLSIFLINFVSAQFGGYGGYGGGYGGYGFSITDMLDRIGSDNIIYLSLFLIFFAFLFGILTKTGIFQKSNGETNKASAAVISLCISLLIIYGFYRSGQIYQIQYFLSNLGISPLWILAVLVSLVIILKLGIGVYLITAGLLLALGTIFTDMFYEKTIPLVVGIGAFLLGLWIRNRSSEEERYPRTRRRDRRRLWPFSSI